MYLTIADKSYPRKLAFSYLDELAKEFEQSYGAKVDSVRKPYAFVGFGMQLIVVVSSASHLCPVLRYFHVQDCTSIPRHPDSECGELTYGEIK